MVARPGFFRAESEEALALEAEKVFQCPMDKLKRIDFGMTARGIDAILCPIELWEQYKNMDTEAHLYYLPDGVFLEVLPHQGGGKPLDVQKMMEYISAKGISNLKLESLKELAARGYGYEQIAPAQEEQPLNERLKLTIAADEMSAEMMLQPMEPGGKELTKEDVGKALQAENISYGVDWDVINAILTEKRYDEYVPIAIGLAPVEGVDGELTFHFNRDRKGIPHEDAESGKVDFKNLDWIEKVTEGQLLVSRTLATPGEIGYTVRKKELVPRRGKECKIPKGQKVRYNESRTEIFAAATGCVEYKNDTVQVSNVYEIQGDLDMSVGNVEFDGDVVVHGNVGSGLNIKATNSITVYGGVQDSVLEAGGDVTIMHGMQGKDTGTVIAGGTLTVKFAERSKIRAKDAVRADEIIYSEVNCGGDVIVSGKCGCIVGGVIRTYNMVAAKTIGALNHPKTKVETGVDPKAAMRCKTVETLLETNRKKLEDLKKICDYLSARMDGTDEMREKLRQAFATKMNYIQTVQELEKEFEQLQSKLEKMDGGIIHVLDAVYPGAILSFSGVNYAVSGDPIRKATFRLRDGDVEFFPCDFVDRRK